MNEATIALILNYGLQYGPAVISAVVNLFNKAPAAPTQADWDALIAKCSTTSRQQMIATLAANGIGIDTPQGLALLALVP
jgi:hypothetical protein